MLVGNALEEAIVYTLSVTNVTVIRSCGTGDD